MLSSDITKQLREHFGKLTSSVQLVLRPTPHSAGEQLLSLLEETAACHPLISVEQSSEKSEHPYFEVYKDHQPVGMSFLGIPTGHEFTSLVLAILGADLQVQLPDASTIERIRMLQEDLHFTTYISLSCTNCPLIVQAMNLMVAVHPSWSHTMADGAYLEAEMKRLDVHSVPSLYHQDTLIHAGRATFGELLEKLEQHFKPTSAEAPTAKPAPHKSYDLAVIGGGPAGISAAVYSARKGTRTAIITDALGGQLLETQGIENFISVIYTEGAKLAHNLARHIREYPVDILEHRRVHEIQPSHPNYPGAHFLKLNTGETLSAKQVIIATGARWRELGVPGEKTYLGKGVAYCPHCDGPYFRGKDVIVVGGGNSGVEAAIDLSGIVRSVTLLEFQDNLKADQVLQQVLQGRSNTKVMTSVALKSVEGDGKAVTHVIYEDRQSGEQHTLQTSAVFVQIGLIPNSQFLKDLVELNDFGEIKVDEKNRTSLPGMYATGDVTTIPYKQIIISMGDGAQAALAAFEDSITAASS